MITREKFKDLIYKMQETNEFYDKLYDLGIDTINCKYFEYAGIFFDELMRSQFGEDGLDLVLEDERPNRDVIADLNNIDDLYDYLVNSEQDEIKEQ